MSVNIIQEKIRKKRVKSEAAALSGGHQYVGTGMKNRSLGKRKRRLSSKKMGEK